MAGMMWTLLRAWPHRLGSFWSVQAAPRCTPPPACFTTDRPSSRENEKTVEKFCKLSIDVRKIRRWKRWVLQEEEAYVEEVVSVLHDLGADLAQVAHVLERCPEAVLCSPTAVATQRDLWQLVCGSKRELLRLIEQFPEAFFSVQDQQNLRLNIHLFQELGLRSVVISRFLTTACGIFHHPVEKNKQMIGVLQESYLNRGGSETNMKAWLRKLLSQNPFILFSSPVAVREILECLQEQGFTNLEILQLLSKLKGFLFQLCPRSIQSSISFSKNAFECTDHDLKQLILKCPALLYYSVPVLEQRIQGLVKEGISIAQIRETPMVLELIPHIVQYRIRKLNSLGYKIKDRHLADLNGTKKEFEANFGKIQAKRERPVFNPVAPLNVEE